MLCEEEEWLKMERDRSTFCICKRESLAWVVESGSVIAPGLMAQAEKNGFRAPTPVQQISLLPALGNTQKAFPGDHRCGHSYTTDQYRPTHTFSAVNYEMQLSFHPLPHSN
ncbi:hypothetical protein CDAR_77571 [Caerostris darwini]|uniref:RNA helicase n=1 Tax=Caerostris darwini TaxID=1538125 RepID=A0AAV4Q0Y9_9ARAC|nr:hypothetical protein CDAR_77571 [Caerostris darwini]